MRIAVPYEMGLIFQHFGRTEFFMMYDTQDKTILSRQLVSTNGQGHGALAGFLVSQGVQLVICGGIGGGAQSALAGAGISLCSGANGNTDEAVKQYLAGNLQSVPVACHHHHEGEHTCGHHC